MTDRRVLVERAKQLADAALRARGIAAGSDDNAAYYHAAASARNALHDAIEALAPSTPPACLTLSSVGPWIRSLARMPDPGQLIVKRWDHNRSVWAGYYHGSAKEGSFDEWVALEALATLTLEGAAPLTDEQIARLWFDAEYGRGHTVAPGYAVTFARAIEKAHGIGDPAKRSAQQPEAAVEKQTAPTDSAHVGADEEGMTTLEWRCGDCKITMWAAPQERG